ncbi:hypothetical protein [Henriciella aquimarina]|uniref:hypothetical protein n=1 Tax=Henriciella aquimarina TaxID=545261 RepID=UPI001F4705F8|nr:hypothetical protein [Henriciella aquimarina]
MPIPSPSAQAGRRSAASRMGIVSKVQTMTPLLAFPVGFYVLMTWFAGGQHTETGPAIEPALRGIIFGMPMISGVRWTLSLGDLILFVSLVLLSFEIVKATSSRSSAMVNHAMSMGVLLFCLVMFLTIGNFATSTFFLLTMMSLMDVLVGVIVSIVSARRDFGVGDGFAN